IPLSAIRAFADELHDIDGNLHIDTSVKGNLKKPDILAVIKFEEIGMSIPSLSQKLAGLNGSLELNEKGLKIDGIKGNIDTGSFALSGQIDMKDYKPEKLLLTLKADALPIAIPDTMDLTANADITMSGTPDKSKLDGDITILEGSYTKDVDMTILAANAGKKKRESSPVKKQYEQPFLKDLSLGIQVRRRQAFIVDNNMVHMELHPDLAVYGKLHNPLVSGRAEIMEGTITYQKSPFEIKRGVIDFVNPYKIEATIDIDSEMEVRKWKIFLAISGTPENLDFKLTSDPVEEDTDIFALLTTGKTARELIGNEGGSSQSPAKMVAELVASALGEELKDATGLDTLEVEFDDPASDTNDSSDRVKVTLGKDLSRRMSVKYAVESKDGEMVQRAITEYKFLENLLMTGFQDSNGTFGGELQFRLDFR
ncbi:translocation/assembly module TamB domain-containing protein, partial [Desulfobacterales bacterium HSG16]|nr:translocation/assembly module TamB domain-containing protein [Desulfobacterales bacterium HSG16]